MLHLLFWAVIPLRYAIYCSLHIVQRSLNSLSSKMFSKAYVSGEIIIWSTISEMNQSYQADQQLIESIQEDIFLSICAQMHTKWLQAELHVNNMQHIDKQK